MNLVTFVRTPFQTLFSDRSVPLLPAEHVVERGRHWQAPDKSFS